MIGNNNEAGALPDDVELLLPWHAAGTLSRRDAARVEAALADDRELASATSWSARNSARRSASTRRSARRRPAR